MHTWGTTTTVLLPAGLKGKCGRFTGKFVKGKMAVQTIKITKIPRENRRVDRSEHPHSLFHWLATTDNLYLLWSALNGVHLFYKRIMTYGET